MNSSSRRRWSLEVCADLSAGVVVKAITSDSFQTPTTAVLFGKILAVVNAKSETGFPPTADQYEVVLVRA